MFKVNAPEQMNETFARAFNSRELANLMALYEPDAILRVDAERTLHGRAEIAAALEELLQIPGQMVSRNHFCLRQDDIALLRADFAIIADGAITVSGSTAEIVRRQSDGTWLYVIDHAAGASLPAGNILA